MKPVLTTPSNRIRYYYENILRYDLLLKLNYKNIMEVPQIRKIIIYAFRVPYNNVKNVSLALEIICGQKVFCTSLPDPAGQNFKGYRAGSRQRLPRKNSRQSKAAWPSVTGALVPDSRRGSNRSADAISLSQSNSALLYCSLRDRTMYNFLEKLLTDVPSALTESQSVPSGDSKIKIQGQEIQVTLNNREVRLFPEIQNHFEFFECFQAVQIKLLTSANNENETRLLWTGFQQKEI